MQGIRGGHSERPLVKTKIIATVGPACESAAMLRDLAAAGVDVFRLNFVHGTHDWLDGILKNIRQVVAETRSADRGAGGPFRPEDPAGETPRRRRPLRRRCAGSIRPHAGPRRPVRLHLHLRAADRRRSSGRQNSAGRRHRVLRVTEKRADRDDVVCLVEQGGCVRSRQGVNLPGVKLSTPSLTEKDRDDLRWAVKNGLDFIGLSFVRQSGGHRRIARCDQRTATGVGVPTSVGTVVR